MEEVALIVLIPGKVLRHLPELLKDSPLLTFLHSLNVSCNIKNLSEGIDASDSPSACNQFVERAKRTLELMPNLNSFAHIPDKLRPHFKDEHLLQLRPARFPKVLDLTNMKLLDAKTLLEFVKDKEPNSTILIDGCRFKKYSVDDFVELAPLYQYGFSNIFTNERHFSFGQLEDRHVIKLLEDKRLATELKTLKLSTLPKISPQGLLSLAQKLPQTNLDFRESPPSFYDEACQNYYLLSTPFQCL